MAPGRVLLMYISEDSGHRCASIAVERALKEIAPRTETMAINAFNYTNPILEKVINRAYLGVIRSRPEIWDYLYDNPRVLARTRRLREMIHTFNSPKLKVLIEGFRPDAVVCTQAFPCGMVADYKKTCGLVLPLVGVLTDYAPHSYWIYNNVDRYVVPSEETGSKLVASGVAPDRVKALGIPIDPKFGDPVDKERIVAALGLSGQDPIVLVMGGTQGLGPVKELVRMLDGSAQPMQIVVVCGSNRGLYAWLSKKAGSFRKKVAVYSFAHNVNELMAVATVVVTKAGGMTTAEALATGLPMVILKPLPGQEAMNTAYLLKEKVAVKVNGVGDCALVLEELLYNNTKLQLMSANARRCARPRSATDIARLIMELGG